MNNSEHDIKKNIANDVTKKTTADYSDKMSGPTSYNQMKLGSDFMVHDSRLNKQNIDSNINGHPTSK